MQEKDAILLRDPDAQRCAETRRILDEFYDCAVADTAEEALAILARRSVSALVVREQSADADGVEFCRALFRRHPELKVVLIAGGGDHSRLIDAFNQHCLFRCLIEPVSPQALTDAVRDAVRRHEMDRIQNLLVQRAAEIDRQISSFSGRLCNFRTSLAFFTRTIAGSAGLCIVAGIVLLMAGVGFFLLLYYFKSALGIDFFGDRHLRDCLLP